MLENKQYVYTVEEKELVKRDDIVTSRTTNLVSYLLVNWWIKCFEEKAIIAI